MTLLDRFLSGQIFRFGMLAILIFTIVWLAPEILFRVIQGIAHQTITFKQGLEYLVYQIPTVLSYSLPIAALVASVFLFRQLSLSAELIAILSSGISLRRLLLPIGCVGLLWSGFFLATQEYLIPWAAVSLRHFNDRTHFEEQTKTTPQVAFVQKSARPPHAMEKFLLITPLATAAQNQFIFLFYDGPEQATHINRIITATHGRWLAHSGQWDLQDGVDYSLNDQGIYNRIEPFNDRLVETSPVAHALLSFPQGNPAEFQLKQLERYVRLLKQGLQTEDARFYAVRLYQRYLLSFMPLLFALLGTAIGIERSRAKRNLGLTYAAILLLFYNILIPVTTTIGSIGLLTPLTAAVLPIVLSALAGWGIIQLRRSEG